MKVKLNEEIKEYCKILKLKGIRLHFEEIMSESTVTSAMIDRLTYKAILVNMEGDSYRLRSTLRENGASMNFEPLAV